MFPHIGSKKNEVKYLLKYIKGFDFIVEPFGGAGALAYHLHSTMNYKIHLNDSDPIIFEFYKMLIKGPKEIENFISQAEALRDTLKPPTDKITSKEIVYTLLSHGLVGEYVLRKVKRAGGYDKGCAHFLLPLGDAFSKRLEKSLKLISKVKLNPDKVIISCNDYKIIFEQYKDNENVLMFLDPPYLFDSSAKGIDNTFYGGLFTDDDFITIYEYLKICKCKILFVVLKSAFMKYLFKDFIVSEYVKNYAMSGKKVIHLIITNYKTE